MKLTIYRDNTHIVLEYRTPERLSTLFARAGIPLSMPCGGQRRCLKCRVIAKGALSPLSEEERRLLSPEEIAGGVRYACMTEALGDAEVWLPDSEQRQRIQVSGSLPQPVGALGEPGYGAAFDIGTTTIAAYLCRMESGEILATASRKNPQAVFGADVISRITRAMEGEGQALADAVRQAIAALLDTLAGKAGIPRDAIRAMVLTGNTAMEYLLMGYDPTAISRAPFAPDHFFGVFTSADRLGLGTAETTVYLTRCISAYVGGDITSGILATRMKDADAPVLLADIGTNGELALAFGGKLFCCSTAAGPAFEGAGIYQGMTASDGAISRVWAEDGGLQYEVIGGGTPQGICGSGIIDAVAACLALGYLDETGAIDDLLPDEIYREVDDQPAIVFPNSDILLTQKDIRAVQLAKSAICSGMETLLAEAGLSAEQMGQLLIAGGFGTVLNLESAAAIGLIPKALADKARPVGNAAGMGAILQLLTAEERAAAEALAGKAETLELSTHPVFREAYIENMMFE
ncbi:MAG: DUF4445 domain-containing protein [Ruminococcaceae bacterium]|nr:DUF4445 domain-containing protein [Oscillospiraceae bacterium]